MSPSRRNLDYLPRVLSKWGFCSRKEAERLVIAGRVTVNGAVRHHVMDEVDPGRDAIAVDGAPLRRSQFLYAKMHKPVGIVTTMKDPEGRPTVASLVPPQFSGAMPVGRLDFESSGLLLLTNDHTLAHRIAGPNFHLKKVYEVEVGQHPDDARLEPIRAGIELDGGEQCRPAQVTILERRERSTRLEVVIDEGKFRQIRRSLKAVGLRTWSLHRVRVGPIELGPLAAGRTVALTSDEVAALKSALG
jgi:23S rRNA pseudouridine2605 synthase